MLLAAGLVAESPLVTALTETKLVQFTISPDQLDETSMMDSGNAPPGRYVGEMLHRLRNFFPDARYYLGLNPYFQFAPESVHRLLRLAHDWCEQARDWRQAVLIDDSGRPFAYVLRSDALVACPPVHLALLSGDDGKLDARFLDASLGAGAEISVGQLPATAQAFNFFPLYSVMHRATKLACESLRNYPALAGDLHSAERTAILGYHAGDMLWLLEALALEKTSFRSVLVPPAYEDIVAFVAPHLERLIVRAPLPFRPSFSDAVDTNQLVDDYLDEVQLSGSSMARFFHILRPPFRDYNRTRHHFREAVAFAVGGNGHALRALPHAPNRSVGDGHAAPGRIVLHLEAGWALKEFPGDQRGELLEQLLAAGYQPILLGKPEPGYPQVPAQRYTNLSDFRRLLDSAQALIGTDSFPTHFSTYYGVPTVQLFSCTKPQNARERESASYRYLFHPLPCVPCYALTDCKQFGGRTCYAHAKSSEVFHALEQLLESWARAKRGAAADARNEAAREPQRWVALKDSR